MRTPPLSVLLASAGLALWMVSPGRAAPAADRPDAGDAPAARFLERLEAHMRLREPQLRWESLEHYALIHALAPADLERALAPVSFRPDGHAWVLGVGDVVEYHGGGILGLLFEHWRPGGRAATAEDRFSFQPNGKSLALGEIYAGHRSQIFLPVPGRAAQAIRGALPETPQLARMRFVVAGMDGRTRAEEKDAYSFLRLLVARETDCEAGWTNRLGQRLSVALLLRQAYESYLAARGAETERADHSRLHLVEILLAHHRNAAAGCRAAAGIDPDAIKARFLSTELARSPAETDDEALAHYAESLGWLAADPAVRWSRADADRVQAWLRSLDAGRFRELASVEAIYLAHLLRGLRMLNAHAGRLAAGGNGAAR